MDAQHKLGVMYDNGQGVQQDYAEAAQWYRKAADQGHSAAQCRLGEMYYEGQGALQDNIQAHMWFNLAAAGGEAKGSEGRSMVAGQMTPPEIAEAQRLARNWKPTRGADE